MFWEENEKQLVPAIIFMMACFIMQSLQQESFRPSCKAKTPLKENTIFDTIKDALKNGFRPCKMCRPDLNEATYEPNKELIERAKELITNNYSKSFETKNSTNAWRE